MNTGRLIHMPQCSTIDLSALCNSSNSIWKTIESHRWVKLSCENIGMCLSYCVPFTLVIQLINCWDFIQIWYDNKMLSSQWDNDNQHFVYIIVSWYLLGIITRQGFLFSCACMNRCTLFNSEHNLPRVGAGRFLSTGIPYPCELRWLEWMRVYQQSSPDRDGHRNNKA